ncbi:hypothetical protein COMA2_210006 [Candidatus Nitrospira nitrificans]|uniref:Uncharacterized protein n=1 Tax=Candidatus Nitrospira nitrificans TaxID=1742973 RepID=A0A0S4LH00_9BACT|nr:hypothetical protein COMA2_210006 [Candidatus Nitrospira nitrificans]
MAFLLSNLRHPFLRAMKCDETNNIWQARVDVITGLTFRLTATRTCCCPSFPIPSSRRSL